MQLTAVFTHVPEGGYVAFVEELPRHNTQGATLDEARENLREAVGAVIEANHRAGRRVAPRPVRQREPLEVAV